MSPAERYRALTERVLSGELDEAASDLARDELADLWWELTPEEQAEEERRLTRSVHPP